MSRVARGLDNSQRVGGDENTAELLQGALERAQNRKAKAVNTAKKKATPAARKTHAVNNENVHDGNESARQVDSREQIDRDSELPTSWSQPNALDAPDPRPGYANRWVRYRLNNSEDADNLDSMLDQGWRPVKRSRRSAVHELTADLKGKYSQYIVKKGLILMELPAKLALQRARFYDDRLKRMTKGVDEDLFRVDRHRKHMPLLKPERATHVTNVARRGQLSEADIPADEAEA